MRSRKRHHVRPVVAIGAPLLPLLTALHADAPAQMVLRTERFDTDPGWDGHNNRIYAPATVTQNFGHKLSSNAGGTLGEVGGLVNPSGEAAYYAKSIAPLTLSDPLSASGTIKLDGGGNTLLGFFNSSTVNEWRTANSVVFRLYGRGSYFLAYPEYATSDWRAGAGGGDFQFPVNQVLNWSLNYDPAGNGGGGTITAVIGNTSIGNQTRIVNLDPGHKLDGATFDRFGLLNVNKSYDSPGSLWIDNVAINGAAPETFTTNPNWTSLRNNTTYTSNNVRFRFDFGYSNSNNAGGAGAGEAGGHFFRGDSRQASTMAFYGGPLDQTLTLDDPLHASGKVSFHRGVTDSTVHFGFFHDVDSVRVSDAQGTSTPENFIGVSIEGPSREGFFFYPSYNTDAENQGSGGNHGIVQPPYIYPNGDTHDWTFDYNPNGNNGNGQIIISLDGQQGIMNLEPGHKASIGAHFNRFGFVTTHIDGNGQTVYIDDVTYTVGFDSGPRWAPDASGNWHSSSNWVGGVPNAVGAAANFDAINTAGRTVFANSDVTVGSLHFNSPNPWLLTGIGTLTLQAASGSAQVDVEQGAHAINLPLHVASDVDVHVNAGAQLTVGDPVTVEAGRTVTHRGAGTVTYQSTLALGSGATVAFGGSTQLQSIELASEATVDVGEGAALVIRDADYADLRAHLRRGFNDGDWRSESGGITSSDAADDPLRGSALGLLDRGEDVLVRFTLYGDTDLTGSIEVDDLQRFINGYRNADAAEWFSGDFDFSGRVDLLDFDSFLRGLRRQGRVSADVFGGLEAFVAAQGLNVDLAAAVPEPAALGIWTLAAGRLLLRRRRRRSQQTDHSEKLTDGAKTSCTTTEASRF